METVKSSNIAAIGYDDHHHALTVRFTSGATHRYQGVTPHLHRRLMAADSIGSYFHQHIRGKYEQARIDDNKPEA